MKLEDKIMGDPICMKMPIETPDNYAIFTHYHDSGPIDPENPPIKMSKVIVKETYSKGDNHKKDS